MMTILTLSIFIYPEVGIMMRCSEVKSVVEILRSSRTSRLVQLENKTIMMVIIIINIPVLITIIIRPT